MVNDSVSDMLIRIKNGYMARKKAVSMPWSKLKEAIAKVLFENGYLTKYKIEDEASGKVLRVELRYDDKRPALTEVKRISRPSLRIYTGKHKIPRVLGGLGVAIVSTPMGVMTDREARKKNVGGEVICEVW